jgi:DNA-binding response OmpR family regulator
MDKLKRALIVEDELALAKALELTLKGMGYVSLHVSTLSAAYKAINEDEAGFDLLLLDRRLPDGDGIAFCRDLRLRDVSPLVLMLTASGETVDRIEGLRAGADDYLPKPFSWEELVARIEALERRATSRAAGVEAVQSRPESLWHLKEDTRGLVCPLGEVVLTDIETKLMRRFLQSPGKVLPKKLLLKEVWGLSFLTQTRTVDWFVSQLRKKIEIDPSQPKHLCTLRGEGYRFDP